MVRQYRVRSVDLPDLYVKNHAINHPLIILTHQMVALRNLYVVCGPGNLASSGGLKKLSPFKERGDAHED